MPSPFPGMDPYLEAPGIWPDLHERLETGIVEEGEARHRIVPDVAIARKPHHELFVFQEPLRHQSSGLTYLRHTPA